MPLGPQRCWSHDPTTRPTFAQITTMLSDNNAVSEASGADEAPTEDAGESIEAVADTTSAIAFSKGTVRCSKLKHIDM